MHAQSRPPTSSGMRCGGAAATTRGVPAAQGNEPAARIARARARARERVWVGGRTPLAVPRPFVQVPRRRLPSLSLMHGFEMCDTLPPSLVQAAAPAPAGAGGKGVARVWQPLPSQTLGHHPPASASDRNPPARPAPPEPCSPALRAPAAAGGRFPCPCLEGPSLPGGLGTNRTPAARRRSGSRHLPMCPQHTRCRTRSGSSTTARHAWACRLA